MAGFQYLIQLIFIKVLIGFFIVFLFMKDWKTDRIGLHYKGKLNRTISGRLCQPWGSSKPHEHRYGRLRDEGNFCRNPDVAYPGPWCYTMDPQMRWEFCPLYKCGSFCSEGFFKCNNGECIISYLQCNGEPDCPDGEDERNCENSDQECKDERSGVTYRGRMNISKTGKDCMPWNFMYKTFFGNNNYCRTLSGRLKSEGPRCYTQPDSKGNELCFLPKCDIYNFRDDDYFKEKFDCPANLSTTVLQTDQNNEHDFGACACSCKNSEARVLSPTNVMAIKRDIQQKLGIQKQNTSMYRRTKSSAPDGRISSFSIGIVGVTILVCVASIIVLLDFFPTN